METNSEASVVEERIHRRMAAILAADVAGYSRLMGEDEEGTLAALKNCRAIADPIIAAHHGRIFGGAGDSLIAEFASPVEAVRCAMEIQSSLKDFNADIPDQKRLLLRIGINFGDIMIDDGNLMGDGVNIAARLESLADPGGVCVSRTILDHVADKLDFSFDYQGEQQVKNISRPVAVYSVLIDHPSVGNRGNSSPARKLALPISITLGAIAAIVLGLNTYWQMQSRIIGMPAKNSVVETASIKPSLVVLPFANFSDDQDQEYFVDGITADLITDFSKLSGLVVTARNSSFVYKGHAVDVNKVAEELGVRYVLEGSVRRVGDQLRINAQLIDTTSGEQLWANRFDETMSDIFEMQDRVTRQVISELSIKLSAVDEKDIQLNDTSNADAYEAFLRGSEHYRRFTPDDFVAARDYFDKALELDLEFGRANAALALLYTQAADLGWARRLGVGDHRSRMLSGEYLELAWNDPTPLAHRAAMEMLLPARRTAEAYEHAKMALTMDPSDPENHAAAARALIFLGRPDEALTHLEKAFELEVHTPAEYFYLRGLALFGSDRFEEAIVEFQQAINRNPNNHRIWIPLASALAHAGSLQEAIPAINNYRESETAFAHFGRWTERGMLYLFPYRFEIDWERLKSGLNEASETPLAVSAGSSSLFTE